MSHLAAVLIFERGGGDIPVCRTRDTDVIRDLAARAMDDVRTASAGERDPTVAAFLRQEAERLAKAFETFGLRDATGGSTPAVADT